MQNCDNPARFSTFQNATSAPQVMWQEPTNLFKVIISW